MFGKAQGGGRRSAPREQAPPIAVFTTVARSCRGTAVDVSATGARLRADNVPQAGEVLEVSIDNVRAFGTVMWSRGNECGIEFDKPLTRMEVHRLRCGVSQLAGLPPELKAALEDWNGGLAR